MTTETLVFTFPGTGANDPCDRYREWCGFGRFPKGAGFQVEYVTSAEDAAGEGVFEKVLSSVRLVGEATPGGKAAPGLVRRQAGAVTLAMPVELQPPTSFHFVREEKGSKARLTVAIAGSARRRTCADRGASERVGDRFRTGGPARRAGPRRLPRWPARSGRASSQLEGRCHADGLPSGQAYQGFPRDRPGGGDRRLARSPAGRL